MENQKEIPLDIELSSDDFLALFCDITGQNEEQVKEWFPLFQDGLNLTFILDTYVDYFRKPPEGSLLPDTYGLIIKNGSGETIAVAAMYPGDNPNQIEFMWYTCKIREKLAQSLPLLVII